MERFSDLEERKRTSELKFDGKVLHLYLDVVTLPNGAAAEREVIRHMGAVCIVPLTADGNIVVERQYRYPIGQVITEIPAGKLESRDEAPLPAARRELREETGITADEMVELGVYYPAPAYCDEKITMFLARGLHYGTRELDDDEFLNVEQVPLSELQRQVMAGEIPDAKTQLAILKVAQYLKENA